MSTYTYSADGLNPAQAIDRSEVLELLATLRANYAIQGWKDIVAPEAVVDSIVDGLDFIRVHDSQGYTLVGCGVSGDWFTSEIMVVEEFVVGTARLSSVVDALSAYGKTKGATRLILGTRAVPRGKHSALARLYESTGCVVSCVELTKEIP